MYYIVYKITNKINEKIYIGIHKTNDINDGYMGSGKLIKRAIEKYGIENFKKEILEVFDNSEDMFEMESLLVNEKFVQRQDTYNIKQGGFGGFDYINNNKDKEYFEIRRLNSIGLSRKGIEAQKRLMENDHEWKKNISEKASRTIKKFWEENGHNWLGRLHSEETKKKMSESAKGKHEGEKNSQFGTMWIYNIELKENKKIKKEEFSEYEIKGWLKGRKMKF